MTVELRAKRISQGSVGADEEYIGALEVFGAFTVSLSGTWVGTISVLRSYDGGTTWLAVQTYTANDSDNGVEPNRGVLYKVGFTAYTSGTCNIILVN